MWYTPLIAALPVLPPLPAQRQMPGLGARGEPGGGLAARLFCSAVSTSAAFSSLWDVFLFGGCFFVLVCIFPNLPSSSFSSCSGIVSADTKTFICLFIVHLDHTFNREDLREAKYPSADTWAARLGPGLHLGLLGRSDRVPGDLPCVWKGRREKCLMCWIPEGN